MGIRPTNLEKIAALAAGDADVISVVNLELNRYTTNAQFADVAKTLVVEHPIFSEEQGGFTQTDKEWIMEFLDLGGADIVEFRDFSAGKTRE